MASKREGDSGKRGGKAKGSPIDRLLWSLLVPAAIFFVCNRAKVGRGSPWTEILGGVQLLCLASAFYLAYRAYPHPIRSLNKNLASERVQVKREKRRKKGRKRRR